MVLLEYNLYKNTRYPSIDASEKEMETFITKLSDLLGKDEALVFCDYHKNTREFIKVDSEAITKLFFKVNSTGNKIVRVSKKSKGYLSIRVYNRTNPIYINEFFVKNVTLSEYFQKALLEDTFILFDYTKKDIDEAQASITYGDFYKKYSKRYPFLKKYPIMLKWRDLSNFFTKNWDGEVLQKRTELVFMPPIDDILNYPVFEK